MPSVFHEAIVELFRQRPMLAAQLLGNTLSVPLPSFTQARIESAAFADLTPPEYRADLVVVLGDQSPVLGVVVEVQLGVDAKKRLSWPHYATSLRARLGCPTCVLVYAPNERVARWAGATVPGGPGWTFAPIVIGPDLVPVIDVVNSGMPHPELAVLSVVAHGNRLPARRAALVATAAVRATEKLRDELRMLYYDLILGALSDAARKEFEAMDLKNYAYKSAFGRNFVA